MNQLICPFCGPRELHEYEFRKTRDNVRSSELGKVYLRIDSLESSTEYWQHLLGCRAWLLIRRNPSTGAVLDIAALPGVGLPDAVAPAAVPGAAVPAAVVPGATLPGVVLPGGSL